MSNSLSKSSSIAAIVLAAVGGGFFSQASFAAAVTAPAEGTVKEFSKQFTQRSAAVGTTLTSTLPVQTITTVVASQSGDRMTINLGGTAGAQFAVTTNAAGFGVLDCAGAANWTFVSGTTTQRVYQSDGADGAGACTLTGATLTNASLGASAAGGTITLSASLTRDVTTIDTAPAVTVATVVDQFSARVALAWDGIIDYVGSDGRDFTDAATTGNTVGAKAAGFGSRTAGQIAADTQAPAVAAIAIDDTALTDNLVIQLQNRNSTVVNAATLDATTGLTITINGDFSVLNNTTAEGCVLPGTANGNSIKVYQQDGATEIGSVTATTCDSITITLTGAQVATILGDGTGAQANALLRVVFLVDAATTKKDIKWQSFTGSAVFNYVVASSAVVQQDAETTFAPGAHTANGSRVFVPYLPVGTNISQVIQLANNSARSGTVTMTARNQNGVECSSANMGGRVAISPNRITDLSAMLAAGIANCYTSLSSTHKLFVVVTADVPDTAIELYTSYNVGGDRVAVVNSSNGRATATGNVGGGNGSL